MAEKQPTEAEIQAAADRMRERAKRDGLDPDAMILYGTLFLQPMEQVHAALEALDRMTNKLHDITRKEFESRTAFHRAEDERKTAVSAAAHVRQLLNASKEKEKALRQEVVELQSVHAATCQQLEERANEIREVRKDLTKRIGEVAARDAVVRTLREKLDNRGDSRIEEENNSLRAVLEEVFNDLAKTARKVEVAIDSRGSRLFDRERLELEHQMLKEAVNEIAEFPDFYRSMKPGGNATHFMRQIALNAIERLNKEGVDE